MGYIPNKLLHRELITRYGIRFDTHKRLMEDYDFFLSYYTHVKTVYFFDECGYHYVEHSPVGSTSSHEIDYFSLLDTHRRCMLLSANSTHNSEDYNKVLCAIGKLTLALFLELRPITFRQVNQKLTLVHQRSFCLNGLRLIHPKQKRLRRWILSRSKLNVYLYLKGRMWYLNHR